MHRILDEEPRLTCPPDIWFRTLIKIANMNGKLSYKWHEMTFLCRWDAQCSVTLCIGVDVAFQNHLQQALHNIWPEVQASRNFSLLIPLAEAIVTMYDISVWSIRDIVRQAEKVSTSEVRMSTELIDVSIIGSLAPNTRCQSFHSFARNSKTRHPLL